MKHQTQKNTDIPQGFPDVRSCFIYNKIHYTSIKPECNQRNTQKFGPHSKHSYEDQPVNAVGQIIAP